MLVTDAGGQTCSCAGAPLISAQGAGAGSAGHLVIGLTFEHHEISRVYSGTTRIGEETTRSTRTLLLETHYGLTDRLSVSSTLNLARKVRTTGADGMHDRSSLSTTGIGDALFLVQYALLRRSLFSRWHLALGAGAKAPVGSFSLRRDGHPLNADMQPGTGSWDGIVVGIASVSLLPGSTADLFTSVSYRRAGAGERFGSNDRYRFGNEILVAVGASNGLGSSMSYTVSMQYRATDRDELNGTAIFNTGARWLLLAPSVLFGLGDDTQLRIAGRYPLWQRMQGTQPSTTFALSASVFFNFKRESDVFTKGSPVK